MILSIAFAVLIYVLIGFVFALSVYVTHDGDRNEDDVICDFFLWPILLLGAILVVSAKATKAVGNWILKLRKG